MANQQIELKKWHFQIGVDEHGLEQAQEIEVPHTWNVVEGAEEHYGTAWYGRRLEPDASWFGKRAFLHFEAVYHSAEIYLNGVSIGSHRYSGYTSFECELTDALKMDEDNWIVVKVDNDFSDKMLPYERSFDWANDGGIIRPVTLFLTGDTRIQSCKIHARPIIFANGLRQNEGSGAFSIETRLDGELSEDLQLVWEVQGNSENQRIYQDQKIVSVSSDLVKTQEVVLSNVKYWHFDAPHLYTLKLTLQNRNGVQDEKTFSFGFREIKIEGPQLFLNGEAVRLCGTEWMPGSDPETGMAESTEQLEERLIQLKESNCVLTRFHWQQADFVYEWCDKNGLLVQEEVPFWGKSPEKAGKEQEIVFNQQITEMVNSHGHHPSIFSWGVGNELNGQDQETVQYIEKAIDITHRLDDSRFANYVTNTIFGNSGEDGTTKGDILMINDYIGTWHGELNQQDEWNEIVSTNPDKPIIPAEFGLCEPAWSGGDQRRGEIFIDKMSCYRKYPSIVGTINFCLNDYRTQMGEDGSGRFRKRVHGSTDLCGQPKPSYYLVKRECAPIELKEEEGYIHLHCRNDLPSYAVQGYFIEIYQPNGKVIRRELPDLCPGENWSLAEQLATGTTVKIFRPTGSEVLAHSIVMK